MRTFDGQRENSSNDESVDVVPIEKNGRNVKMNNEKVGSKVKKFESIFSNSWRLFLKERVPSLDFKILTQHKSATNDLYIDWAWKEQAKFLITSLETVNKRLDKLV